MRALFSSKVRQVLTGHRELSAELPIKNHLELPTWTVVPLGRVFFPCPAQSIGRGTPTADRDSRDFRSFNCLKSLTRCAIMYRPSMEQIMCISDSLKTFQLQDKVMEPASSHDGEPLPIVPIHSLCVTILPSRCVSAITDQNGPTDYPIV
jgi:hypothetical protein